MSLFIVLEGIDGCGKSTQVKILEETLAQRGLPVMVTRWQDSTYLKKLYIGDLIKRIQKGEVLLPPESRTFLLGADIANRVRGMILPWLEDGRVVIGDRYIYKIVAQGVARGLDKPWLRNLFGFAPEPDVKIMLDVPPRVALERITSYREVSFYEAGLDVLEGSDKASCFLRFQGRVRGEMLTMMNEEGGAIIQGELPLPEQSRLILDCVDEKLRALTA